MPKSAPARKSLARIIADEVQAFGAANANPELVKKYSKYFREGYDAWGLDHKDPQWNAHLDDWVARLHEAGGTVYLEAADLLLPSPKYEDTSFAIRFAVEMRDGFTPAVFDRIGTWFAAGIRQWAHTDVMSSELLAPFIIDGVVPLETLVKWRESPHKYQRRAVPVTMVTLLKRRSDYKVMIEAIEPLMSDPEREVHQGVGWLLREIWKKDPKLIERFLAKHKETAPRLIFQYATEKMTPDQKARFKRSKASRAS
jgi:3-methyladenine DNA glycosylase AlkD